jgi:NADPH:quinone reductase-like Zn-dependent oxidoreductase
MSPASTMRAVVMDRYGSPDVLHPVEAPVPVAGPGEVLVEVHAIGVNAIDWKTRAGRGVPVAAFPVILGWDVSGVVVTSGPATSKLKPGDEVFATLRFPNFASAYAEFVAAPEDEVALKPSNVEHVGAAGAMAALTAWQSLFDLGGLVEGQRVLIHGAAGGVGHVAVQLARAAGAQVIATASAANRDFLVELGADTVVDYRTTTIEETAESADIVVDTRGGEDFDRLLSTVRPNGILVTLLGEQEGQRDAAHRRGLRVGYAYVAPNGGTLGDIAAHLADGRLKIHVSRTFELDNVAEAHKIGDGGHVRGLLVLDLQ